MVSTSVLVDYLAAHVENLNSVGPMLVGGWNSGRKRFVAVITGIADSGGKGKIKLSSALLMFIADSELISVDSLGDSIEKYFC
mmetsp:Transcript_20677/g.41350  ORF Transcript_20677/g.41350 Transcript_20677/m.41350 type:complete len:83 (-) Transcript_20677:280-528(-)